MTTPEVVIEAGCLLGESPVWDAERSELLFVDIRRGDLHHWSYLNGEDTVLHVGYNLSAVAPRRYGGYAVATRLGFGAVTRDGSFLLIAPVESELEDHRMNDGKCDHDGRFLAGTMSEHYEPKAGSLYRLELDGTVTRLLSGVTVSNGLDWSPDGSAMYYVDSRDHAVDVLDFDVDETQVIGRRRFVEVDARLGRPDGLCVDEEGCIWLALHSGGAVHRYSPAGELIGRVEFPVELVTSCAFGGPDLSELFITTAVQQERSERHAGSVFRYVSGTRGFAGRAYRG